MVQEVRGLAFDGVKAIFAGVVKDRVAAAGVAIFAVFLLLTAWVLGIVAAVIALSRPLGMVGALLVLAGALVVVAVLAVWITSARNRRSAELRATTRALWAATAVNAASAILRGESHAPEAAAQPGGGGTSHRSAFLIAGGLALILLALLVPGHGEPKDDAPGTGPDSSS